jgi:hypothetical protein
MPRRSLCVVVVAVAVLLATGCGGSSGGSSDTTATTTWADGLCSAITTWTSSIAAIGDALKAGNLSKDSLTSAVDDAKSATETFTSDLDDLGKPDTEAGAKAKESIDQLSTDLKADVTKIRDALENATGVSGIVSAVSVVSTTVTTMGNQVSSTISGFQNLDAKGELESAFKQAQSCDKLTG